MKIIGLTGGIGGGKSTAARFLMELGAEVIDLDSVGHEVIKKGSKSYKRILEEFGEKILDANGDIDRAILGRIVFSSPEALNRLNSIVHPEIDKVVDGKIKEFLQKEAKVLALEAAALLEADKTWQVDEVWVVFADEAIVLERLKERPGYNEADVKARIRSQMTYEDRIKQADVAIGNNGTLNELKAGVKKEWDELLKRL